MRKLHADWWQARIARQKAIDASIAAKAEFEYLYDKPYIDSKKVRVAGPFTVESLSPHRVLTVGANDSGSHRGKGWEAVTECAIKALAAREEPLVAILWGRDAQNLAQWLPGVPTIASPHPSPLSASRGFFGSRPFSRANDALVGLGAEPVDWRLP